MEALNRYTVYKREFWTALWITNECPFCGYKMNGVTYKWELLDSPSDCECNKCGEKWAIAIEKDDQARREIKRLLELEKKLLQCWIERWFPPNTSKGLIRRNR